MSVLLSSTPQNSQRHLLEAAAQLAQGVMLDITPQAGPACPASLSSFDKVAKECAVCLPVFYVTSFFNMQLQARLHLGLPNGNSAHLPPLLASVHDQHCILMLAASFCPDRHGPRMFERFRALVGGKRAEKPKQRPNYKVQKAVGKKPALAVRRALRRVEHRRTDVFTDVSEMQVDSAFAAPRIFCRNKRTGPRASSQGSTSRCGINGALSQQASSSCSGARAALRAKSRAGKDISNTARNQRNPPVGLHLHLPTVTSMP